MPENLHAFDLDDHHRFPAGKPVLLCGNTADMLTGTRYAAHFIRTGDRWVQHGAFPCAPADAALPAAAGQAAACC